GTTRVLYDLFAYARTRNATQPKPAAVYTLSRVTHASDLTAGQESEVLHRFTYSDGFGRIIQEKGQAAPEPHGEPRWIGSGWTIFNNKGNPVRHYEPFFSSTHEFEFSRRAGVSSVVFYDALDRAAGTLHPDHTYERTNFDPWRQESWDVNDTLLLNPQEDTVLADFFLRLADDDYLPTWYQQRSGGAVGSDQQIAAR